MAATPSPRSLPALICTCATGITMNASCASPDRRPIDAGAAPLYGRCVSLMPVLQRQQFHREMRHRAGARGRIGQRAGFRLGERDEFLHALAPAATDARPARTDTTTPSRSACKSFTGSNGELLVYRRADGDRRIGEHQRVAVGRRLGGDFRRDVAAGARAIVDHHLLPQRLRELLRRHARDRVAAAAGGKRHAACGWRAPGIPVPAHRQRGTRERQPTSVSRDPSSRICSFACTCHAAQRRRLHQQGLARASRA